MGLFSFKKNKAKSKEKLRVKEQQILQKQKEEFENNREKYTNPKLNVNNKPGKVLVKDDNLYITAKGRDYIISYGDIKSLQLHSIKIIIKTNVDEFKITPQLGYNYSMPWLFDEIQTRREGSNKINGSEVNDLEKLVDMYEKDLLSDEEFEYMKKKIIK